MSELERKARGLAAVCLKEQLPRRWRHTEGVAAQARRIAAAFGSSGDLLVASAWLHDIGYSPSVQEGGTEFHPLDGARYLRAHGWEPRLYGLVAHHSCAIREAELRGLGVELSTEFEDEKSALRDALWCCDMTTSPDGQRVSVEERLDEITRRYGPGTLVARFIRSARSELTAAVERTETLVAEISQPM